jgi:hypothetical protein
MMSETAGTAPPPGIMLVEWCDQLYNTCSLMLLLLVLMFVPSQIDTHAAAAAAQHPQVYAAQHAAAARLLHRSGPCTAEHHLG